LAIHLPVTSTDSGQTLGGSYSYGIALGDLDGDGDLDAFVANYGNQPNKVWLNIDKPLIPRETKENVRDNLSDYIEESQRFSKAIKEIDQSLNPEYWVDDTHLYCEYGHRVFSEERHAVKELMHLLIDKKRRISDEALNCAQDSIEKLTAVDRILVETLIIDAEEIEIEDPEYLDMVNMELVKANEELAKGDTDRDAGKFDKAIQHYRKDWDMPASQ